MIRRMRWTVVLFFTAQILLVSFIHGQASRTGKAILSAETRPASASAASAKEVRPPEKSLRVAVRNPANESRIEDVVLKIADVQRSVPGFGAPFTSVTIVDGSQPVELAWQADDLNGDGKTDELAFQVALKPEQTRIVTIAYGGPGSGPASRPGSSRRTDAKFAQHYDGMGWESENTAWRLYFDKRNAIDLWGKRKRGLYLETFAAPNYKYQEESPLARDIYNVGKSLGAGGVGAWADGHAIPVADVASRNWRIVSTGPVRAIVEFTYKGWQAGGQEVGLTSRITQWAAERGYEHRVSLQGPDTFPLVVGLSRKPDLQEVHGDKSCSLAIWGHQVVRPGTGATDSLPDQNLGLAILVPDAPADCQRSGDPMNYVVQPQIKEGSARWYVLASWDQEEDQPVRSEKDFSALVTRETSRLMHPASVTLLDGDAPQAGAADAVKILSGADVRAAFEKGSPLLQKNGHNYWVLAGRRDKPGQAELHEKDLDVFYVLQGSATFVTGGKMVNGKTTAPDEVRGDSIEGGETHTLSKDDVVIIPPGIPHWFKDVQGLFLYYVVKVQQP